MPKLDESDDRPAILAPGFRLSFFWMGDRWSHSIDIEHDSRFQQIAVPIEGQVDAGRILSPALQQLQFQHRDDNPDVIQALLVGQSGAHHFSVVFTVHEMQGSVCLSVEVADRCRLEVHALASTYVVDLPSSQIIDANTTGVSWSLPTPSSTLLSFESIAPARTDLREAGRRACQVQVSPQIYAVQPNHCWAYRWTIRNSS